MRKLASAAAAFLRERLTKPLNRNDRRGALYRAWGHVFTNQLKGAYYEFGVYQGESFRASRRCYEAFRGWQQGQLSAAESWRRGAAGDYAAFQHAFYAFDTFAGMPRNAEKNPSFAEGNFSCSLERFSALNRAAAIVEGPDVRYFQGAFAETLGRDGLVRELQPAAIANIDCDLYGSARDALALIEDKLIQGSVVLMDDWNTFAADPDAGERKALREFLAAHPRLEFEPWFSYEFVGQAFLVHKRSPR